MAGEKNIYGGGYPGPLRTAVVNRPDMQFVFDRRTADYVSSAEKPDVVEHARLSAQVLLGLVEPTVTADTLQKTAPNRYKWDAERQKFVSLYRAPFMEKLNLPSKRFDEMEPEDWKMVSVPPDKEELERLREELRKTQEEQAKK